MSDHDVPQVVFDESSATRIFPRPELKNAALVTIPMAEGGHEIPTFISPEWGGVQVFYGSYYAIIVDGAVAYGSAREQWELMHTNMKPGWWVKTGVPTAYQATERCRIMTLIPTEDGNVREANYTLDPGDWIVRQPGGEVQHIKNQKFEAIYYTEDEVLELGLNTMTTEEFAQWAVSRAGSLLSV
ncbi:hypothetical protein KC973_03275 [Candidatus Saccharibacteria bacterium]|nr:hypothetical protein [Candidatus Saccharibacteria bacterium]